MGAHGTQGAGGGPEVTPPSAQPRRGQGQIGGQLRVKTHAQAVQDIGSAFPVWAAVANAQGVHLTRRLKQGQKGRLRVSRPQPQQASKVVAHAKGQDEQGPLLLYHSGQDGGRGAVPTYGRHRPPRRQGPHRPEGRLWRSLIY